MATAITMTVGTDEADNNTYASKGRKALNQAYETPSIPLLKTGALHQIVSYAQLTGAMTINASTVLSQLTQGDEVTFFFEADGTERVVTFGTGFLSSGTVTVPIDKGATVRAIYDGTALRVFAREIYA